MNEATRSQAIDALDKLDHAAAELRMLFRTPVVSDCFHALGLTLLQHGPQPPAVVAAALVAHLAVVLDELKGDADILAIEYLLKVEADNQGAASFVTFARAAGLDVVDVVHELRRAH